jgi:hypothetical protein
LQLLCECARLLLQGLLAGLSATRSIRAMPQVARLLCRLARQAPVRLLQGRQLGLRCCQLLSVVGVCCRGLHAARNAQQATMASTHADEWHCLKGNA